MTAPTSTLHARLEALFGPSWTGRDAEDLLAVLAEWLSSDATVERVARAGYEALPIEDAYGPVAWTTLTDLVRDYRIRETRAGLAALAAALAPEGGGEDG